MVGTGAFIGASFGRRAALAWGFELFGMRTFERLESCSNEPRSGVGPLFQVAFVGLEPRLTLAIHAGKELSRRAYTSITGEVGATYRFGSEPGYGLHVGVTPAWLIVDGSLRGELFLDDYSATAGLRFPLPYGEPSICYIGRPLRAADGVVPVSERACRMHRAAGAHRPAREAEREGRAWERDAQLECASVPAFLQLAAELLGHDAPSSLVERALDAACDEIRHARVCAAMASRLLGHAVWPALPDFRPRPVPSLARLAEESWIDGCVGEGAAAKRAERAARLARDGRRRAVQTRIAIDETRHAELAWDILRWTLDQAGPAAREAVGVLGIAHAPPNGNDIFLQHAAECARRRDDLLKSDGAERVEPR